MTLLDLTGERDNKNQEEREIDRRLLSEFI